MYQYRATITRVVDGDTVHANVDLGCDTHINLTLRLAGIDAPERGTPEGVAATAWLTERLLPVPDLIVVNNVLIETVKDRREKYGRYLAYIWPDDGRLDFNRGLSVNDRMIEAGHAVAYAGGKRG